MFGNTIRLELGVFDIFWFRMRDVLLNYCLFYFVYLIEKSFIIVLREMFYKIAFFNYLKGKVIHLKSVMGNCFVFLVRILKILICLSNLNKMICEI